MADQYLRVYDRLLQNSMDFNLRPEDGALLVYKEYDNDSSEKGPIVPLLPVLR